MPGNDLRNAIGIALNHTVPEDVIDGVKSAVIAEIEQLDPAAKIERTTHFNHSYAPDLVLTWKSSARREEKRELYVRYSLGSSQAAGDADFLGKSGPIFFSLDSQRDDDEFAPSIRRDLLRAPRSLFTNAAAIDRITDEADYREQQGTISPSSPLLSLFKRNVVRGGRGVIVEDTAESLEQAVVEDDTEISYIDRFTDAVSEMFDEAATLRLRRAADLVKIALSGDVAIFDTNAEDGEPAPIDGKLDDTELRALLPFLLDRGDSISDARFWSYLGQMMTLSQLEDMYSMLDGHDLTALAQANLSTWRGARSMMSFNAEALEEPGYLGPRWRMHAGTLCASAGRWNVHFASDMRRGLRPREGTPLPQWDDLVAHIRPFSLTRVDLRGIARQVSISVDPDATVNVLDDVESVRGTIDDTFYTQGISVRPSIDASSDIHLQFASLTASGTAITVQDLARTSFGILGHRYPLSPEETTEVLGD